MDRFTELLEALACHDELADVCYSGKHGDTAQDDELVDVLAQGEDDIQQSMRQFFESEAARG